MMLKFIPWLVLGVTFVSPILYILISSPSSAFWDGAFSSLVGTSAALIGGIPAALIIDRSIKRKEAIERDNERRVKEKGLLRLIKEELEECKDELPARIASDDAVFTRPIKSSFWHAASLGGKLNLISNHSLLSKISSTYNQIDLVKNIESQCFEACHSAAVTFGDGSTAARKLLMQAKCFYAPLSSDIDEVVSLIERQIYSLRSA